MAADEQTDFVFKQLAELERQIALENDAITEAELNELDDIDELRRYAAELSEPEPPSFTTT